MYFENYQLGATFSAVALIAHLFLSKPYSSENVSWQSLIKRAVCIGYAAGLFFAGLGMQDLGDEWWVTGLTFLFGVMAFGAAIEAFRKLPLLPYIDDPDRAPLKDDSTV